MMQRIFILSRYLIRSLLISLAGVIYIILALVYYYLAFQQRTPEVSYFILLIGLFGAAVTFLITLSIAARANQALNFPFLVRLPSRIEYLTAVLATSIFFALCLQLLVSVLALVRNGPSLSLGQALEIPPIWLAVNILAAVMALHASDLVTAGWSRVYVYGALAIFLFTYDRSGLVTNWLAGRLNALATILYNQDWDRAGTMLRSFATWLNSTGADYLSQLLGFLFWPVRAITEAALNGFFTRAQALAPAILLLYATILFMLAADLFANKDLHLAE